MFASPDFTLESYMICSLLLVYAMDYSTDTVHGVCELSAWCEVYHHKHFPYLRRELLVQIAWI